MSTSLSDENMSHGDERPRSDALPANWSLSYLGDCGEVVMGQSPAGSSYNKTGVGMALINGPTEFTDRYPIKMQWTTQPARFCQAGDLLICVRGSSTGRTNYADEVYAIGRGVAAIRARGDNNTEYLSYQVIAGVSDILASATGSTFPSVDGKTFRRIAVALPPPSEQRAIAEALSDVDGLIGALEKLIAKKRAVNQAATQQLLTGETRLPGFEGQWDCKQIDVLAAIDPENLSSSTDPDFSFNYISLEDVDAGRLRGFSEQVFKSSPSRARRVLRHDDVLMATVRPNLMAHLHFRSQIPKAVCSTGFAVLRARSGVADPGFLFAHLFAHVVNQQIEKTLAGSNYPAINSRDVRPIEVPCPPTVEEQNAIATVLSDMDAQIEALERRCEKTKQIKLGMMQQLLTGSIRLVKPQSAGAKLDAKPKAAKGHNKQINEAVVISVLASHFGSEQYPLGRKRYTKLSYLLHRHSDNRVEDYQKKAAGPYNPKTRYGGPEKIALQNGYIREHQGPKGHSGFVAGDNIAQAEGYFDKWYGVDCLRWLEQFRRKKNDDLELLATVDMAAEELQAAGKAVDSASVKEVIRAHPEWLPKLDRAVFSDASIAKAIETCQALFSNEVES